MSNNSQLTRGNLLADQLAAELKAKIDRAEFGVGASLPTEAALSTEFGVSRNVVREAISQLRADGVVQTRQGRGTVVLPESRRNVLRIDQLSLSGETAYDDLFEIRVLLEVHASALAAENATDADHKAIHESLEEMRNAELTDAEWIAIDARFHKIIAQASRNQMLSLTIDFISGRLMDSIGQAVLTYSKSKLLGVTISEHLSIARAIKASDPQAAREAMRLHLAGAKQRLIQD